VIVLQNTLVFMFNNAEKAYANISVLLQQRFEELPNQALIAGELSAHEQELLGQLSQLRTELSSERSLERTVEAHNKVSSELNRYLAKSEAYPAITSNSVNRRLMRRLVEFESDIANQREFYNDAVNLYNDKLMTIPNQLFGHLFGFKPLLLLHSRDD